MLDLHFLIISVLCLLPIAFVLAVIFRKRKQQQSLSSIPFNELQRRPAGETLRIKLESLEEQITDNILALILFPILMMFGLFVVHPKDLITPLLFFFISAGSSAFFGIRLYKLVRSRANYRLGFEGERFVGEELCRLIAHNFEIYHDVPFDGFNIDHVLVGPRGVYVIETKTRRKPLDKAGDKQYRVTFDGKKLRWPWGNDSYGIEQAKNNAKTLAYWLSSATGENVRAISILTLPGWMVDRNAHSDECYVLNPKEIYGVCSSCPEMISEPQIRRICHQLNQKCRIELK